MIGFVIVMYIIYSVIRTPCDYDRPGMDIPFAKRQAWWDDLHGIVETDDTTYARLTELVYTNVSDAKIDELRWVNDMLVDAPSVIDAVQAVKAHAAQIDHFKNIKKVNELEHDTSKINRNYPTS
jgi:hypothetical protein